MSLSLFQVIVVSAHDHNSRFIAASSENEARLIVQKNLKNDEKIHFIRKVQRAIGQNKTYKIVLQEDK